MKFNLDLDYESRDLIFYLCKVERDRVNKTLETYPVDIDNVIYRGLKLDLENLNKIIAQLRS